MRTYTVLELDAPAQRGLVMFGCLLITGAMAAGPAASETLITLTLSLQPLVSEDQCAALPQLAGDWVPQDRIGVLRFEKAGKGYRLLILTSNAAGDSEAEHQPSEAVYDARPFATERFDFLDLSAAQPPPIESFLVPTHFLVRLEFRDDEMKVAFVNTKWLMRELELGRIKLGHTRSSETLLLTASTRELQEFLQQHAWNKDAFSELSSYRRKK